MTMTSRPSTSARRARSAAHARSKAILGRYLATGLGATGLGTMECEAGVVNIDVTSLGLTTGANAGVSSGGNVLVNNFLGLTGRQFNVSNYLVIPPEPYSYSYSKVYRGIRSSNGVRFATYSFFGFAKPQPFLAGDAVGPAATFASNGSESAFLFVEGAGFVSPDFSLTPAKYMGFRVAANGTGPGFNDATQFHYGYFQVTWTAALNEFRILSGAYESTVNTPITTVPEPTSAALIGVGALALGAGAIRRSRKARRAAAQETPVEAA